MWTQSHLCKSLPIEFFQPSVPPGSATAEESRKINNDKEERPKPRWKRERADEGSGFVNSKACPARARSVLLKGSEQLAVTGTQNRRVNSKPSDGLGVLLRVYVEK